MNLEQIAKTAKHNHNVRDAGLGVLRDATRLAVHNAITPELCLLYDREHKEFVISDTGNLTRIDAAKSPMEESDPLLDANPISYVIGKVVDSCKHAIDLFHITLCYGVSAAAEYESAMFVNKGFVPAKAAIPVAAYRANVLYSDFNHQKTIQRDEIRERFLELSAQSLGVPYRHDKAA